MDGKERGKAAGRRGREVRTGGRTKVREGRKKGGRAERREGGPKDGERSEGRESDPKRMKEGEPEGKRTRGIKNKWTKENKQENN